MIDIIVCDWKAHINELIEKLIEKRQGKVSYFYDYDTNSDDYMLVASDKELTKEEIKEAVDKYYSEEL